MKMHYGYWYLRYDDDANHVEDEDWAWFVEHKRLYYDRENREWTTRENCRGLIRVYPAAYPCTTLKAAKRHLRKHNEIPKGTKFKLVSMFIGQDVLLTNR